MARGDNIASQASKDRYQKIVPVIEANQVQSGESKSKTSDAQSASRLSDSSNYDALRASDPGLKRYFSLGRVGQLVIDACAVAVSVAMAFVIRFDGHIEPDYLTQFSLVAPVWIGMQLAFNWIFGVYRRLWRYTGLTEIVELACAVGVTSLIVLTARVAGVLVVSHHHLSLGIIFIHSGLTFLALCAPRVYRRLATEHQQRRHWRQPTRRRALLVGAGDAGQMVLKEMEHRSDLGVDVVGLIDDDPDKFKKRIGSLTVFGGTSALPNLIENLSVDQVIIAMPSAPAGEIRRIVEICRNAEVETRILPGLFELIGGRVSVSQLREVSLEDLLGREPVKLDSEAIADYITGRSVLVTGAGGSIGSELCRQIIRFSPARLVLVGKGENSIFGIQQELQTRGYAVDSIIADVRDENRMRAIFEQFQPEVVFHAAAHKHVPLMEANVAEAIANNVFGTRVVAQLSDSYGIETFVLVSSDKAVNPTSVMGTTKRCAELVVQDIATRSKTKFVAVRFGNVLASRGSVIPLWRQQIAQGGPVTVTHPDATRYFMLIPEAVQLILEAGALGKGGEIFVLDMGQPVKILDLANDLIRLSGLRPETDIKIEFVGLRPGEKLYEELLMAEEGLAKTHYAKIFVGQPQSIDSQKLADTLSKVKEDILTKPAPVLKEEITSLINNCYSNR